MNADSAQTTLTVTAGSSRGVRILSFFAWTTFALLCLLFFTILKLPQGKIHAYVTGYIGSQLSPMGIQFAAESGGLELGMGLFYKMENVTLTKMASGKTMKISHIEAAPSVMGLLQGKIGVNILLEEGQGQLNTSILTRGDDTEIAFQIQSLNLGLMGVLPFLADIQGTAELSGEGEVLGNFSTPSTLSGNFKIGLSRIVLDQQSVLGILPLPKTTISDGVIDLTLGGGKALVNQLRLGKAGGTSDVYLSLTGDVKLGRSIDSSEANLRGKASLPESLKQTLPSFITQRYKTPDGSLAFRLNGPLNGMFPAPDTL